MEIIEMEKENNIFKVLPNFMIRTAMLPIESINEIKMEQDFFPSLKKFLDEGFMDEAILIASPDLNSMLNKDMLKPKEQKKVADSLFKYISRTFSRATPFGLFASVGTGKFEGIQITDESNQMDCGRG